MKEGGTIGRVTSDVPIVGISKHVEVSVGCLLSTFWRFFSSKSTGNN